MVGIDCNQIISASGAIHCITHSVGVEDPLLISHQPLDDTEDTVNPYPVEALVQHRSGIESTQLFWRVAGETDYNEVAMDASMDDMWVANIPAQPENTVVQYYIQGASVSGKVQDRPMPAPEGYWQFRVGEVVISGLDGSQGFAGFQPAFPNPASAITCIPVDLKTTACRSACAERCSRETGLHTARGFIFRRHLQVLLGRCTLDCRRICVAPGTRGTGHLVATLDGPLIAATLLHEKGGPVGPPFSMECSIELNHGAQAGAARIKRG